MPLPPAPPDGYQWMPFIQRVLRALPVHPVATVLILLVVADAVLTLSLVLVQPANAGHEWRGFVDALLSGFWADYLTTAQVAFIVIASIMMRRHLEASIERLRPHLDLDDTGYRAARTHILSFSRTSRNVAGVAAVVIVIYFSGGFSQLIRFDVETPSHQVLAFSIFARVVILLWASATLLLDELVALWRLSAIARKHLKVDVYGSSRLAVIGQVGVIATLYMAVGVTLAIPLLSDPTWTIAPSLYLLTLALGSIVLLVLPAWGARKAIVAAKAAELQRLESIIATHPGGSTARPDSVAELGAIVDLRDRVDDLPEWPFGAPTVLRWLLIVSIPVGSWFAGALVERFVDAMLG